MEKRNNILRAKSIKSPFIILLSIHVCINFLLALSPLPAQEIIAEITTTLETLPQNKRDELQGFAQMMQDYINNYEWTGGKHPYSVKCQIGIFFESVISSSWEDRYRGRFYVNTETGIQYVDKNWDFAYNKGEVLTHNRPDFSPLLGLVDYYIYLVIGEESDKLGNLQGTPYFNTALDICNLGKFSRLPRWWDNRAKDVDAILSPNHEPFRLMQAQFEQTLYLIDEKEINDARKLSLEIFKTLESIKQVESERAFLNKFFDLNQKELLKIAKIHGGTTMQQILLSVDPAHADYYKNNW